MQCVTWHLSSIFNLNSFERDRPYWNILGYISTYLILMRNLIDKTTRISRRTHWISHLNSHDIHMISVNEWCAVVSKEITVSCARGHAAVVTAVAAGCCCMARRGAGMGPAHQHRQQQSATAPQQRYKLVWTCRVCGGWVGHQGDTHF